VAPSTKRSTNSRASTSKATSPPDCLDLTGKHPSLVQIVRDALTLCAPPPELTVSQWADRHRMLSPEVSSEPGQWRTDRVPYMRGIMDAFNDASVREINVLKGTQLAYTESLLNIVGYCIDVEPCPLLWLLPDQNAVEEISKNRLAPMLRDTPRLQGKVKAPRSRDSANTIATKQFPGGRLSLVGSHAPSQLASRPIRVVIEDECDRFAMSAGAEGDPSALAAKRQAWFWNRKTIRGSSPTIKGRSKIASGYEASDKRMLYVPCPHCGDRQTLRWEQVKWDKVKDARGRTTSHDPLTARYQCEHCGELWDDADRWAAIAGGEWRATAPFRGNAGFFLPQFYSTVVKLEAMVAEFLAASGKLPGTVKDVGKLKVWTNTVLAECWEEVGEAVDGAELATRGEAYGPMDLPDAAQFTTAGVDVQVNRLEVQIVAWGPLEEAWAADYVTIFGNPAQPQVWEDLDRLLLAPLATRGGRPVRILAACVDTGGHHGHQVHEFCRPRFSRRVFAIKGDDGLRPVFPKRPSRTKTGHSVYIVGVDLAKDTINNRLRIRRRENDLPTPGYIHFPAPSGDKWGADYFAQLTSEQAVTRFREGRAVRVWLPVREGAPNEALDTFVYALAARQAVPIMLNRPLPTPTVADEAVDDTTPAPMPAVMPTLSPPQGLSTVAAPLRPRAVTTPSRMERLALMQRR
jgi:phage terminase large subunit GpA-like protein